jgi:hypothetical protein
VTLFAALICFTRDLDRLTSNGSRVRVVDVECLQPLLDPDADLVVRVSLSSGRARHYAVTVSANARRERGLTLYIERCFFVRAHAHAPPLMSPP